MLSVTFHTVPTFHGSSIRGKLILQSEMCHGNQHGRKRKGSFVMMLSMSWEREREREREENKDVMKLGRYLRETIGTLAAGNNPLLMKICKLFHPLKEIYEVWNLSTASGMVDDRILKVNADGGQMLFSHRWNSILVNPEVQCRLQFKYPLAPPVHRGQGYSGDLVARFIVCTCGTLGYRMGSDRIHC